MGFSYSDSSSTGITTAYPATGFTVSNATNLGSLPVPQQAYLYRLEGKIDTIAGGATSVTWWLAVDFGGEVSLTDEQTVTILDADGDAAGSIQTLINTAYVETNDNSSPGVLYLFAKTDAGTCNLACRLFWGTP